MNRMKAKHDTIVEREIKGGLKDGIQKYKILYLHPNNEYSPKISIEHRIETVNLNGRFYSIRFEHPVNLLDFAGHCLRAYIYFKKKLINFDKDSDIKRINETLRFHIQKELK